MNQAATVKGAQKQQALDEAEADYRAGILSVSAIARKYGLPESTLRRDARRLGWTRASPEVKRLMVREAMAGGNMTREMTKEKVRQIQIDAAEQDVIDMNSGLSVARSCLHRLLDLVDMAEDPRDLKTIVEANRGAIETIRKIRSLDAEKTPQDAPVTVDISNGFAELEAAFDKRLGRVAPD